MSIAGFDPEIVQDFLTESGELLEQLEGDLVSLEENASDLELVNRVFRALHTIKGSASFLALTNLVEIAHAAETALNAARSGSVVINGPVMDLLLRAVDTIKVQFDELHRGAAELTAAEPDLVQSLIAIGETQSSSKTADDAAPGSGDADTPTRDAGEAPFVLPPGKEDLLDHFLEDVERQLDALSDKIERFADDAERAAAAPEMLDIAEDLIATIDFFECDAMLAPARTLTTAARAAARIGEDAIGQITPRLEAVLAIMRRQAESVRERQNPAAQADGLIERLNALFSGASPDPSWTLEPGASANDALRVDSVAPPEGPAVRGDPDDLEGSIDPPDALPPTPIDDLPSASPTPAPPPLSRAGPQPPAPAARPRERGTKERTGDHTIRVEVDRLESLMNLVGELVLQKNRIGELAGRVVSQPRVDAELAEQLELAGGTLDRVTSEIQVAVMRTRMQPLDKLFGRYPRLIRDLAQKTGKKIRLAVEGGETEVDRSVIEELGDPLVHLIRNSADHGLEPPEERTGAGKPDTGTITLRASQAGDHVLIEVIDDGRGLNRDRIARKAVERGLVREAEVANLTDDEVARFIMLPGFSTADEVSDLSGRGVGMDVVRTNIEAIKGTIDVTTTQGHGTTFSITIPLTVAIMQAMLVAVHDEQYAIPLCSILEIVRPEPSELTTILQERVLRLRDSVMPLLDAADVFGVPRSPMNTRDTPRDGAGPSGPGPSERVPGDVETSEATAPLAVVLSGGERELGLLVTRVIGQQEIVIKPLDGIESRGPVSGATVRNDGGVSLIVDVAELLRSAGNKRPIQPASGTREE